MKVRSPLVRQLPALLQGTEFETVLTQITAYLKKAYPPKLILDFSRVQGLTIEAIDGLLECLATVAKYDGEVKLAAASQKIQIVLELTQISKLAQHYNSVQDAIDSWNTRLAPSEPTYLKVDERSSALSS